MHPPRMDAVLAGEANLTIEVGAEKGEGAAMEKVRTIPYFLGQWLNFKLFGITYLVGKIKFKLFFQGPLAK